MATFMCFPYVLVSAVFTSITVYETKNKLLFHTTTTKRTVNGKSPFLLLCELRSLVDETQKKKSFYFVIKTFG